jgi:hypothetical protein
MSTVQRTATLAILIALVGTLSACATRQPMRGQEARGFDRKLSTFAYIEEGDLVTVIVDTKAARDRDGRNYMPLEIAILNTGLRQLPLTLESFTLLDGDGNRYPAATARELFDGYEFLDFDRNLAEIGGIVYNKFGAYARYPSNFSPTLTSKPDNLVRELVSLPKHGYLIDWIYFPEPPGGIRGQPFELFVNSPALQDPVFVKFEVR